MELKHYFCLFIKFLFTFSTAGGLTVIRVPGAERGTVAVLVPAGVALSRGHTRSKSTADAAVRLHGVLVAVALGQTGTVVVPVSTGVGRMGSHTLTQPAALGAGLSVLLTVCLGEVGTVGILVLTGLGGGERSAGGSSNLPTGGHSQSSANSTHANTSLQPDEASLTPASSPGVLDEPVVLPVGGAVAHHRHGVVRVGVSAAGEDATSVVGEGPGGGHGGDDSSVLGNESLQLVLVSTVGVVAAHHLSSNVIGLGAGAGQHGGRVEVGVGGLVGELQRGVGHVLDVGVGGSSVTTIGSVLLVTTVHQLLLAEVSELSSCSFLQAGLDSRHAGEGDTAAALLLVLDRRDEAGVHSAVAGGDGGSPGKERGDVSLGPG